MQFLVFPLIISLDLDLKVEVHVLELGSKSYVLQKSSNLQILKCSERGVFNLLSKFSNFLSFWNEKDSSIYRVFPQALMGLGLRWFWTESMDLGSISSMGPINFKRHELELFWIKAMTWALFGLYAQFNFKRSGLWRFWTNLIDLGSIWVIGPISFKKVGWFLDLIRWTRP